VDAVEALVHEAAALGHDALALAEVAEVDRARTAALVAHAQAADPGQDLHVRGHLARAGQEGAHLLAVVEEEAGPRCRKG
jgi:hypothetical protein